MHLHLFARLGHLQGNDIESRRLRSRRQCHLVLTIADGSATVVEVADIGITVRRAGIEIPGGAPSRVVVIEPEEALGIQSLERHECLVEVLGARHGLPPHLAHGLDVAVMLAQEIEEPIRLVAVPLMREGHVVGIAEHIDTLREHLFGKRLVGLPLRRLFPDGLSIAHSQMEPRADGRRRGMFIARSVSIAHVVEGVPHLMGHGVPHRLAGRRSEPQRRHLEIVATAIAHPVGGVVEQHHHFIVTQVGGLRIDEAQLIDFQVIEILAFLQQVLFIDTVWRRCLRWQGRAIALVPEDDHIVGLHGSGARPGVAVVGVVLGIEQRVGRPGVAPLIRDIDAFLRIAPRPHQQACSEG